MLVGGISTAGSVGASFVVMRKGGERCKRENYVGEAQVGIGKCDDGTDLPQKPVSL